MTTRRRALCGGGALLWAALCLGCGARGSLLPGGEPSPAGGGGAGSPDEVVDLSVGASHACALMGDGAVLCWGGNWAGALGDGGSEHSAVAVRATALPAGIVAIAAGTGFSCAVTAGGGVLCWGVGDRGQLGKPGGESSATPVPVQGLGSPAVSVTAGDLHACALLTTGKVACWGMNFNGELGHGSFKEGAFSAAAVVGLTDATRVAAGVSHTCAVRSAGEVVCWGDDRYGELGNGPPLADSAVPVEMSLPGPAVAVATGWDHTCAAGTDGWVRCAGNNFRGQLGDGSKVDSAYPRAASGIDAAVDVVTGLDHSCALLAGGGVACWGSDNRGELGDGDGGQLGQATPRPVVDLPRASRLAAGYSTSCAALVEGGVMCWGDGNRGQLGHGESGEGLTSDRPVAVQGL